MIIEQMASTINRTLDKIHNHPFNQELAQGTLTRDKFIYYLMQDALYLADFGRALAITAARLPDNKHMQQFIQFTLEAIKAEQELHANYFNQDRAIIIQNPACFMYTNYLLRMASLASVEEATASLLPCFFIYHEVGKKMANQLFPDHPYYDWIALYGSESFAISVQAAITIVNDLGYAATEKTQTKMIDSFAKATQLEWLFWQGAYHQEQWMV